MDTALPQKFPFILDRNLLQFSEGQLHRKSGLHVLWYSSPCQEYFYTFKWSWAYNAE